jgi:glycosyltransferase involved in cell wall biosynthesis
MKVLYISYDGMTDPLAGSQIIPYLTRLVSPDIQIHILSFEKPAAFKQKGQELSIELKNAKIVWHPLRYTKHPVVLSTIYDLIKMHVAALFLHFQHRFKFIHCRSYLPALCALNLKKLFGLPFLFDTRGLWADERVEGGAWPQNKIIYRMIYRYFKSLELRLLKEANKILFQAKACLTDFHSRGIDLGDRGVVIPCCVDLNKFSQSTIEKEKLVALRNSLGISSEDRVMLYLGSIGGRYLTDKVILLAKEISSQHPSLKLMFVVNGGKEEVRVAAERLNFPVKKLVICSALRKDVPLHIALSDLSVMFVCEGYSNVAVSPVRVAEILAMGVPMLINSGIGDMDKILTSVNSDFIVDGMNSESFAKVSKNFLNIVTTDKKLLRSLAEKEFDLNKGVAGYRSIYSRMS